MLFYNQPLPETQCFLDSEIHVIVKVFGDPLKSVTFHISSALLTSLNTLWGSENVVILPPSEELARKQDYVKGTESILHTSLHPKAFFGLPSFELPGVTL